MWSLEDAIGDAASDCECEEEIKSRELRLHDRSTAVGQVKLLRAQAGIMRARSLRRKYGLTETIALLLMNTCTIPGREEICWLRSILGTVLSPSLDGGGRARDLQPNTNQRATAGDDGRRWEDFDRGLLAAEAGGAVVVTAVKGQRYALVARCL